MYLTWPQVIPFEAQPAVFAPANTKVGHDEVGAKFLFVCYMYNIYIYNYI